MMKYYLQYWEKPNHRGEHFFMNSSGTPIDVYCSAMLAASEHGLETTGAIEKQGEGIVVDPLINVLSIEPGNEISNNLDIIKGLDENGELRSTLLFIPAANGAIKLSVESPSGPAEIFVQTDHRGSISYNCSGYSEAPPVTEDDEHPVSVWLTHGKTGISSETIAKTLFPEIANKHPQIIRGNYDGGHPHDPSDFIRCQGFFEAVPGSRDRLGEMSGVSPQWAALVENWEQIEDLLEEDLAHDSNRAPETYKFMRQVLSTVEDDGDGPSFNFRM